MQVNIEKSIVSGMLSHSLFLGELSGSMTDSLILYHYVPIQIEHHILQHHSQQNFPVPCFPNDLRNNDYVITFSQGWEWSGSRGRAPVRF